MARSNNNLLEPKGPGKQDCPETSPFDQIREVDAQSRERWPARKLMGPVGYKKWQHFRLVVLGAMEVCRDSGHAVEEHLRPRVTCPPSATAARARSRIDTPPGAERPRPGPGADARPVRGVPAGPVPGPEAGS